MPRQVDVFPQNLQITNNPNNQIGVTSAQISNLNAQIPAALEKAQIAFINSVLEAIDEATGWDLLSFALQVEAGITNTGNFATDLWNYLFGTHTTATNAWNNWTTLLEELGLPDATATALVSWLQTLLEPNSPLNAGNLWGLLPFNLFGLLPSTSVTATVAQPLYNPNFESAISVSPGSGWSWDSTVYYMTSVNMPGSAKVVADGATHGLRANSIPVQGGQTIAVTAQILTSGLVATGTPIEVDVITFKGNTQVAQTTEASSGAPSGATTSWVNPPGGSVAGTLTGSYLVPNDGTVDSLLVRLGVGATATAGSVWFGSVSVEISGGYLATIEGDLSALSADFTAGNTAFATFLQSVLADITGYTNWSTFIAAVESQWTTYITTATNLTSAEFFTFQQLLNTLLGINASTGQMLATNITNIFGGASLAADVQAILDYIANALGHSGTGHTLTQIETYLGLIPPTNVTNVLGGTSLAADIQAILDYIANALGHTGTGHTLTQIETYLGLIPPANVTSSTGAANLAADISGMFQPFTSIGALTSTAAWQAAWAGLEGLLGVPTSTLAISPPTQVASAQVANVLGNGSLGDDLTTMATQLFGSAAVNNITTVENDIINFLTNAISGGDAPTSSNSAAQAIYDALLGIPHTNVMIPPSPGSGTITHDANANGTPYSSTVNNFVTITYNHTVGATANYLIVRLGFYSIYTPVGTVTYSGQTMQLLGSQRAADNNTYIQIYGLANPASGTGTISVTLYSPLGNAIESVAVESDSYIGVGSVGSTTSAIGVHSNPSLTISSATGDYIAEAFFTADPFGAALSSYNKTSQYNSGSIHPSSGPNVCLLAGDAAGASSVTFTATAADTSGNYWTGIAVNLVPLPSTVIGSVFRAANTSTGTVSSASGDNYFGNSFFNTTVTASTDLTYFPATNNEVKIAHAGTYSVTIAVLMVSTFNNQLLGLSLQQNFAAGGSSLKRGNTQLISNGSFSTYYVVSHTFQVYCSAGDTLQPAYYCTTSGSAFTGTTDGLSTYFEVSLNNRGLHS